MISNVLKLSRCPLNQIIISNAFGNFFGRIKMSDAVLDVLVFETTLQELEF